MPVRPPAPADPVADPAERTTQAAKVAVSLAFAGNGFGFATWASRVPELQRLLDLTPGRLGLLLLCVSAGAVTMLPLSGALVRRLGAARTVVAGGLVVTAGLLLVCLGAQALGLAVVTGAGLFAVGAGTASWDVAMNVEGAEVERRLRRTVMPRFHAAFSLGTVAGALLGFVSSGAGLSVAWHLSLGALAAGGIALGSARRFLPVAPDAAAARAEHGHALGAWREPRVLLLGVLVMCAAFTEGVANDWLAVGLRDGYGVSATVGVLGFALFVTAMTAGRLAAGPVLDRFGRVPVVAASFALVIAGALVTVFSPSLPLALAGAVVWGVGASIGFPVGISAASDGGNSEARVSVVATIGYTAFLAGPPLVGFLGDRFGVHPALLVVAVVSVPGLLLAGTTRPTRRPA